ncbi:hypothetical protein CRG98_012201 [Punica granatum]|uniref:Uncharacterized protein n=1 Tax=Punica granatum TaxID=22663 RepID=A0A2I0KHY0_PUNGR|nr:hypothetical protein CRG98_012201 [Punica granatum]
MVSSPTRLLLSRHWEWLLGRGDLGRAVLSCWAAGIWTGPRWDSRPGLGGEGGRAVGERELRVRQGNWGFFGRGRAAGLGREVELVVSRPWATCGSRRKVELGVSRPWATCGSRRKVELGVSRSWANCGSRRKEILLFQKVANTQVINRKYFPHGWQNDDFAPLEPVDQNWVLTATLGVDQFNRENPDEQQSKSSFYSYYYVAINMGCLAAQTVPVYLENMGHWLVMFLICTGFSIIAHALFFSRMTRFRHFKPMGNPILRISQISSLQLFDSGDSRPVAARSSSSWKAAVIGGHDGARVSVRGRGC